MTNETQAADPVEFIKLPEVKKITGLGTTSIYTKAKEGEFPKQVKIGARGVAWVKAEVQAWARGRVELRPS